MNLRDGNPADAEKARIESDRQLEQTMSNWPRIRQLEAESLEHRRQNHFGDRIRYALEALRP